MGRQNSQQQRARTCNKQASYLVRVYSDSRPAEARSRVIDQFDAKSAGLQRLRNFDYNALPRVPDVGHAQRDRCASSLHRHCAQLHAGRCGKSTNHWRNRSGS